MAIYRQTGKMTQINPETNFFPNPELLQRLIIMDNGFVFDPLRGKSYRISSNGMTIIKYIQNGANLDQIVENLSNEFHVTREVIERDIDEFIISLQSQIK
jgi:hypothetical protein